MGAEGKDAYFSGLKNRYTSPTVSFACARILDLNSYYSVRVLWVETFTLKGNDEKRIIRRYIHFII